MPGDGWPKRQPDCRDHRQPKRQKRRKRGVLIDPPGFDAGKKIKGKKRHILVDTQGFLMQAIVHSADIQDRDGGVLLMGALFGRYPSLLKLYADSGYQGPKFQEELKKFAARSMSRSSSGRMPANSSSCPGDGWSSGPSDGSIAAAAWPRTGSA